MTPPRNEHAEDFAHSVVPEEARIPRLKLTMVGWSLITGMAWLFYGALAAMLAGTQQAVIGLALSVVVFALANNRMTELAASTGLSSGLVSRKLFGPAGSALIALLLAATTVYFAVFEGSVVAEAFRQYFGADIRIWYAVVVVGMLPLMMGGVLTWMDKVNAYLLPLYVIGVVAALVAASRQGDLSSWWDAPGLGIPQTLPGWLTVFVLYLGVWLVMPTTVDFARFGRPADIPFLRNVTFGWVFGAGIFLVNGVIGMLLVHLVIPGSPVAGETGVVTALVGPLGLAGVLLIVVTQIRINTLNFYQSSMNLQRLLRQLAGVSVSRPIVVTMVSALVFVLMLTDVFGYLQTALKWQGSFFVGWVGIVVSHLLLRRQAAPGVGFGVWVISALAAIACLELGTPLLAELAPLIALAVSVLGYVPLAVRAEAVTSTT
ncbi:purine-cytosine permease family protein [Streptosporangium algeriense]|uniref:Purine-cytosine permease family protein n=1 Tax=Streptosporangium algeriense TaxID=1682748 RepID=A0ABW3DKB0_9ACTN